MSIDKKIEEFRNIDLGELDYLAYSEQDQDLIRQVWKKIEDKVKELLTDTRNEALEEGRREERERIKEDIDVIWNKYIINEGDTRMQVIEKMGNALKEQIKYFTSN